MSSHSSVVRARGPVALEAELVAAAFAERDAIRRDPRRLAAPVAIAVPSEVLRVHVTALLGRELGAAAGICVQTLAAIAHDVIARAGRPPMRGAIAADILLARESRGALRQDGESFAAAALASITDLLDAGLVPDLGQAVLDAALEDADSGALSGLEARMAEDVVRAAVRARAACDELGVARRADVYVRASEVVRRGWPAGGPREIWLHGFADATGLQADWIAALAAAVPTRVLWDDAANAARFGAPLRARLGIAIPSARAEPELPVVATFRARGVEAEIREVLRRARRLLDAGVTPERIGIVARDPGPYRSALRTHAARLAIPISVQGAHGPLGARGRSSLARLEILRDARRVPVERWLAAGARRPEELALLTGLRVLGATRLAAVARLDLDLALGERTELVLPFQVARARDVEPAAERDEERENAEESSDESSEPESEGARAHAARTLRRSALASAVESARALLADLEAWPARAPCTEHVEHLARVLTRVCGDPDEARLDAITLAAADLCADVPATLPVDRVELLDALAPSVEAAAYDELGGRGGGVQFASVAFARGRAFEHLFVLGLNAGVFPANAREDPVLGDDVRRPMQAVLADLPLKRARPEEESATFAQLVASAPHVTASWLVADADDAPLAPSPFLDALAIRAPDEIAVLGDAVDADEGIPQPAHEHALLAARAGGRDGLADVLAIAIAAGRSANGLAGEGARQLGYDAARIARARIAALAEIDRAPGPVEPLGAFFGAVGRATSETRTRPELPVTTLEGVGRCPWQTFVARVLRVQPPLDPLISAPRIDARVTGTVAHALIADTARQSDVPLENVEESAGHAPNWPTPERWRARALELAARTLREEGLYAPGLDALVAARALELAIVARRLDEADASLRVLAAEATGWIPLAGDRRLSFRADRVERASDRLRLVDWKSGAVFGPEAKTEATRTKKLLRALREGTHLQAFVYAVAAGEGRYVALKPDFRDDANRAYPVQGDDEEARARFDATSALLLRAWDEGAFFPRLVDHAGRKENGTCPSCEVAAACIRGDSGARKRLTLFVVRAPAQTGHGPSAGFEKLVRALFDLHAPETATGAPKATATKAPRKPRAGASESEEIA